MADLMSRNLSNLSPADLQVKGDERTRMKCTISGRFQSLTCLDFEVHDSCLHVDLAPMVPPADGIGDVKRRRFCHCVYREYDGCK